MIEQLLKISLLGGLINMDDVPLIQCMVSQPVAAAPLIGWIFGDLKAGLVIGSFLELLMVYFLPIGCAVPMDGSLAAIIATGIFLLAEPLFPGQREALIGLAIALALPFSAIAQRVSVSVRRLNGKTSDYAQRMVLDEKLRKIDLLHLSGIGLFFLRSFSLCLISLLISVPIIQKCAPLLPPGFFRGLKLLYFAYPMIGIALIFDAFRNKAMYWLFALSFLSAALFSTFLPLPAWAAFAVPCVLLGTLFGVREALKER